MKEERPTIHIGARQLASSSSFLTYLLHFLEVENREREQININSLTAY